MIGRPHTFDNSCSLSLILMWKRKRGRSVILGIYFGATEGPLCFFLCFLHICLLQVLKVEELPSANMHVDDGVVEGYVQAVARKSRVLRKKRVTYTIDWINLTLEISPDPDMQNHFFVMVGHMPPM